MRKSRKPDHETAKPGASPAAPLVEVAHALGATLGTAASKAENLAKGMGDLAQAIGKSTVATSRKIYRHATGRLRTQAARSKSRPRKKVPMKNKSARSKTRRKP